MLVVGDLGMRITVFALNFGINQHVVKNYVTAAITSSLMISQ
jgi:hypothetical protein